ncbi:MAG TPA: hypothetical protein VLM40_16950, partial [Gemmata sp.]|nr:hypothetical protein [Gemmata sp.]
MSPAFFAKCPEFSKTARTGDQHRDKLRGEHTGERDVLVLWAKADPERRKKGYQDDHFGIAPADLPKAITESFKSAPDAVKVKSIIDARCVVCHGQGGDADKYPLCTFDQIEKYLKVEEPKVDGNWIKVQEPMSLEKLTQSTHAHLLSFAVLFSLTGLVFAFSSYPASVRCILAPLALVAVVADVALWWLARLSDGYGVYFAMGVIGTGGLTGVALGLQIALSVWNMYAAKGKFVILLIFALAGVGGGVAFKELILPGLESRKHPKEETHAVNVNNTNGANPPPITKLSRLEEVLQIAKGPDGKDLPVLKSPFKEKPDFNMVRALFDKDGNDGEFAEAMKAKDQKNIDELMPQRHAERLAIIAWSKLPEAERKKSYEMDGFTLAPDIAKQITPRYAKDGKLKIGSLIADRCVRCHGGDVKPENQFENYETLKKFLQQK